MARKHGFRRARWAVVILVAVAAVTATVTLPRSEPTACPDGSAVTTVGGLTLCTHGPDAVAVGSGSGAPEAAEPRPIWCSGNGTSGARVQAVYARPAGRADRYSSLLPAMTAAAGEVDYIVDQSAAQTGGTRHVRWATATSPTTGACRLSIARVTVPASAATDFGTLIDSLEAQGLDRHDRKYLVWVDAAGSACTGIATHLSDDRRGQENYNNTSVGYARVEDSCLTESTAGRVETHELLHMVGAVQRSAPHVSPRGHCGDEWDLLCYDDDGALGPFRTTVRCPSTANDRRLDCNHDDYFSTAPPPGSYLRTHWNAADSRYFDHEAPVVGPRPEGDPPPNDAFAAAPLLPGYAGQTSGTLAGATIEAAEPLHGTGVDRSTWFKWRPRVSGPVAVDTRGSAADTVLAVYGGTRLTDLAVVGANDDVPDLGRQSRVTFTAVAGTTYRVAVAGRTDPTAIATEAGLDGQAVTLRWGPPPHGFPDVPAGARYGNAVGWAKLFGVMPGYRNGTWRPRKPVTWGRGLAMLWHLTDEPAADAAHPFVDVPPTAPYRAALDWAVEAGLAAGGPGDTFGPRRPMTRAQMVELLWAVVGRPNATSTTATPAYSDVPPGASYAPALRWAVGRRLVSGFADGTYRPEDDVTRAQMARALFALASDPRAWVAVAGGPPSTVVF